MKTRLVVTDGPESGRTISLDPKTPLKIGRGQASDVRLNDPRISRVHCAVRVGPTGVVLEDAGSSGGTFIAGRRIDSHHLRDGDEIQIGDTCLRFESDVAVERSAAADKPTRLSGKSLEELVGQTIGHFKLERITHTGSNSVLFLARDEKHSRPAMVKVMLPSVVSDEEQRSRFVRAVHTMINVRHDNLIEVYGAGKQGPFCWCAMEYVDGIRIVEVIELIGVEGRLDWRDVYRVAVHVARALECAHRHKVIHRNVTPANLIQRNHDKVVKLCDLMLAKALEGTQAKQVTAPGQLVGDVAYMSPERMVDTSGLDWRSDQYGLGATLYALLTGHPPFEARTLPELVRAVRSETACFPEEVAAECNQAMLETILRMLAKQPSDRYQFPSELVSTLDDIGRRNNVDADVLYNR